MKHFYDEKNKLNQALITRLSRELRFSIRPIDVLSIVASIVFVSFAIVLFKTPYFEKYESRAELFVAFCAIITLGYTAIQIRQQNRSHQMQKDVELFECRSKLRLFFNNLKLYYTREYNRYLSSANHGSYLTADELMKFSVNLVNDFYDDLKLEKFVYAIDNGGIKPGDCEQILNLVIEGLYRLIGNFWEARYVIGLDETNIQFLISLTSSMYEYRKEMGELYNSVAYAKGDQEIRGIFSTKNKLFEIAENMKEIKDALNDVRGKDQIFLSGLDQSTLESRGRFGYFLDNIEYRLSIVDND